MSIYVKPVAAFKKIESAKLLKRNIYIYGSTGYGKTEFIRQYFKNNKYVYISCRNNGHELSAIMKNTKKSIPVIIDDVNSIDNDIICDDIRKLCTKNQSWVIVIGRSKMPSWFYNTFITQNMALITEEDLALSEEEIDKYMRAEGIVLSSKQLQFLRQCNEGNAFAVKYMAQRIIAGDSIGKNLFEENSIMFQNYLENNIISELNSEILDFLLKISMVDSFTKELAVTVSGDPSAQNLIERTMDTGNYIEFRNGVYTIRFHMLMALRNKAAKVFSKSELNNFSLLIGRYYEMHGEDDKALNLYAKCNELDHIRELLIKNSRKNPESGYYIEMRKYYLMLSDSDIRSNVYLMAAVSMLYSMLLNSDKSEYWYNELKKYKQNVTGSRQREAICLIAYLDIALPSRGSVNILQLIKACYVLFSSKSIPIPEFSVTSNQPSLMNGGKDFCEWSKNDRKLAASAGEIVSMFLGKYGKGLVNAALAESFFEKGGNSYEIMSLVAKAKMEADAGGKTELSFAATGTLFRQYIFLGEPDNARDLLDSFEIKAKKENLIKLYMPIEAMRCRLALIEGENESAALWLKNAPDENEEFIALYRYIYLTKVRCYIAFEQYNKAYMLIELLKYYAELCDRKYILMELEILSSIIMFKTEKNWKNNFVNVLEKVCEYKFIPILTEYGATMRDMLNQCEKIYEENQKIDAEWFERILRRSGKIARYYPLYLKSDTKSIRDLKPMDIQILTCIADGLSIQKTAQKLNINFETLRSRIKEIYRKMGVKNKTEAAMAAKELNLI